MSGSMAAENAPPFAIRSEAGTPSVLAALRTGLLNNATLQGHMLSTSSPATNPAWDATLLGLPDGRTEITSLANYASLLSQRTLAPAADRRTGQGEGVTLAYPFNAANLGTNIGIQDLNVPGQPNLRYPRLVGYSNWVDGVFFSTDFIGSSAPATVSYAFGVPSRTNPRPGPSETTAVWRGYMLARPDPVQTVGHLSGTAELTLDFASQELAVEFENIWFYPIEVNVFQPISVARRQVSNMAWSGQPVNNGVFGNCGQAGSCIRGQFYDGSDGTPAQSVGGVFRRTAVPLSQSLSATVTGAFGATRNANPLLDPGTGPNAGRDLATLPPPQNRPPPPNRPPTQSQPPPQNSGGNPPVYTPPPDPELRDAVSGALGQISATGLEGHVLSQRAVASHPTQRHTVLGLPQTGTEVSDASGIMTRLDSAGTHYYDRNSGHGRGSGWGYSSVLSYTNWEDGIFFAATRYQGAGSSKEITAYILGTPSDANPTGTGTATWNGAIVARNVAKTGHLDGSATLTYDFGASTVDVLFANLQFYPGGSTPTQSVADSSWDDLAVTNGVFGDCSGSSDCVRGQFFEDTAGTAGNAVGGVFRKVVNNDGTYIGAFGATRE